MSSAVYLLNDIVDVERDKLHPKKKHRAIPSGQLPMPIAIFAAISLPIVTVIGALWVSVPLALVLIAYYTKDLAYSFYLKNVVIIDVITVASGFIMRVVAGVVVINVTNFSPWLYVVVGSLALFFGGRQAPSGADHSGGDGAGRPHDLQRLQSAFAGRYAADGH